MSGSRLRLRNRDTGPYLLFVLGGLLSFLVGGFLLTQPDAGLVAQAPRTAGDGVRRARAR